MITLLYGDDLEHIEQQLVMLSTGVSISRLNGAKLALKEFEESLLGNSLFGDSQTFVVENISSNKKKKDLYAFLSTHKATLTVLLVERKKLTKREVASIPADKSHVFMLPQYYFSFLDECIPGNGKRLSELYAELLQSMTAEQIFYSLVKRIRALIAIKVGASHSETARFAPWQLQKLSQQSRRWGTNELIQFYSKLFDIEKNMKSGALSMPLKEYIDIMLLTELN